MTFQSESAPLETIILKTPQAAFIDQKVIDRQWEQLNYSAPPNMDRAMEEFEVFERIFQNHGIAIHYLPESQDLTLDSIYCRDASVLSDAGAIICSMGKAARRGEPKALEQLYNSLDIPILGTITGDGRLEGGDTFWLDTDTLAVGRGYRSNAEGIRQLRALAKGHFEVVEVHLPHFRGPADVFHLMSIISGIDRDLLLVYSPLMPVSFRELLLDRGFTLIEVTDREFASIGINVLAIAPRVCVMVEGNPDTQARLQAAGARVFTYRGEEITMKGSGGPTCLTRPLWRTKLIN